MRLRALVLLMLITQSASSAGSVRYAGIKTGFVSATWKNYVTGFPIDVEQHAGFDVGGFVEWFDIPVFSLLTEMHYIEKGAEFVNRTSMEFGVISPRMNYLSVPVLGKARFFDQQITPYFVGGPRVNLLLATKDQDPEVSWKHARKINFGATIGAGVEVIAAELLQFGIEFRYSLDFTEATSLGKPRNSSMELLMVAGF